MPRRERFAAALQTWPNSQSLKSLRNLRSQNSGSCRLLLRDSDDTGTLARIRPVVQSEINQIGAAGVPVAIEPVDRIERGARAVKGRLVDIQE